MSNTGQESKELDAKPIFTRAINLVSVYRNHADTHLPFDQTVANDESVYFSIQSPPDIDKDVMCVLERILAVFKRQR